ncbi:putative Flp pilus assembly protein [Aromatoleum aromaticum EbN1]|uniref:Flp pilus assembly protein n=1 Tax=Aromatoleum aromaticum (strain DSM 19018 / LMG 30748 / EbN1) TaxID=76114 RepID=Q5P3A5_AROAE|nr:type II secretion system F family protein [Aromatoleum aromaticum]CAI08209.1 putative Flp pilus assembly protein [Aromatoleum aromaticum EbN1]
MDILTLLFALATFITVVLFLEGAYLWWASSHSADAKRLNRRLDEVASGVGSARPASLYKEQNAAGSAAGDRLLAAVPHLHGINRLIVQSRLQLTLAQFAGWTVALAALGFTLPLLLNRPLFLGLGFAVVLGMLPTLYVMRARNQHMQRFELQLPEALDLMGRALRAGHAFPTAIKMVAEEMKDPIGGEFRILFDEMNYGVPQQTAMLNLASRTDSTDLSYFVIAVLIQRDSGGNLAELLDNISKIVRARLKLYGEIRTLSAEGKLSAWILGCLPFATAALINIVNPGFMKVLWEDPAGINFIYGAMGMMVLGVVWMRKIIRIRV